MAIPVYCHQLLSLLIILLYCIDAIMERFNNNGGHCCGHIRMKLTDAEEEELAARKRLRETIRKENERERSRRYYQRNKVALKRRRDEKKLRLTVIDYVALNADRQELPDSPLDTLSIVESVGLVGDVGEADAGDDVLFGAVSDVEDIEISQQN